MDTASETDDRVLFWIGLSSIPGVGRATFRRLVNIFGSPEGVLSASPDDLKKIDGLSDTVVQGLGTFPWHDIAVREVRRARDSAVRIVTMDDPAYPENLRTAPDAPVLLYVKGALIEADRNAVAIVGTRTPTHYGRTFTHRLAAELAAQGVTIVSGLARGIDTQAHRGALAAQGRTIAVLGSGIDIVYPPENRNLLEEISRSGAVVTENPFGTKPEAGYFPARNRIISGLSRGTVIVEAARDSGSLITAEYTLKHGRKLFAVPGNAGSPLSSGPNSLIRDGAILVEGADDVVRELGLGGSSRRGRSDRPMPPLSDDEDAVFRCLGDEPKHIDSITAASGRSAARTSGALMTLELKGLIRQLPGKYFIKEGEE